MKIRNIITLTFLLLFVSQLSHSQYKIRYITADDGLARNHIYHISATRVVLCGFQLPKVSIDSTVTTLFISTATTANILYQTMWCIV